MALPLLAITPNSELIRLQLEVREKALNNCKTIEQKLLLKQLWELEDIKSELKTYRHKPQTADSDIGLFGLFGIL